MNLKGTFLRTRTAVVLIFLLAQASAGATRAQSASSPIPARLSDAEFWKLQSDISEPGGYFQIEDNYTSNEPEIGQLFTTLRTRRVSGGVYIGVGPEQNLTYIAAIRPRMAFIIDIRRQAAVQHLMFKAIFEMSKDRADFISNLFSKPRPAGLDSVTPIQPIWEAFSRVITDTIMAARTFAHIQESLTKTHGFALTDDEKRMLKSVFDAFRYYGPGITTRGGMNSGRGGSSRTFADLTGYSADEAGVPRSFLSTEENYLFVKGLHERNLIVPVTGDFAGPKALRAIGAWVTAHDARISAYYLSNVEQYLFQNGVQRAFYDNVSTLPLDSASVFIRPYSLRPRRGMTGDTKPICPISPFLRLVGEGRVLDYGSSLSCGS